MTVPNRWSPEEEAKLLRLMGQGLYARDMVFDLEPRSVQAIEAKIRQIRFMEKLGRARREPDQSSARDFETPPEPPSREEVHLKNILLAGGFSWLRPELASRFYQLERAMPLGKEFWRAA